VFLHNLIDNSSAYILAGMGGLITVRAGVINIALEGLMLAGALGGALASGYAHSAAVGIVVAIVVGVMLAAILAIFHLHFGTNLILGGLAINLIAAGGTVFTLFVLTNQVADSSSVPTVGIPRVTIPGIDDIRFLQGLSGQTLVTYFALLTLPVGGWFLYRLRIGVHMRAAGESESALLEAGLSVRAIRWQALLLSGGLCGLAGAQLSMGTTTIFVQNMTQGRGFIALAAVYLGGLSVTGTYIAALIFGGFDSLATTLQVQTSFPTETLLMIPYVAAIAALMVTGARRRWPHLGLFSPFGWRRLEPKAEQT